MFFEQLARKLSWKARRDAPQTPQSEAYSKAHSEARVEARVSAPLIAPRIAQAIAPFFAIRVVATQASSDLSPFAAAEALLNPVPRGTDVSIR